MQQYDPMRAYRALLRQYRPQGWWPIYRADSQQPTARIKSAVLPEHVEGRMSLYALRRLPCPQWLTEEVRFQICVGAILTQNTSWTNVERALERLVSADMCRGGFYTLPSGRQGMNPCPTSSTPWSPAWIASLPRPHLARLIRPAGYFNQKAKKLHIFSRWLLREHDGSLARFFRLPTADCRQQLLSLWGIGPETADSILLYAGRHPVFVIDAYTKRLLAQYSITFRTYDEYQQFFVKHLPRDATLFNEYHALIVAWGKEKR